MNTLSSNNITASFQDIMLSVPLVQQWQEWKAAMTQVNSLKALWDAYLR